MTLHQQNEFSIPEEMARVARAAYPKGNLYMKMRDALGTVYQDESFAHLFPQNELTQETKDAIKKQGRLFPKEADGLIELTLNKDRSQWKDISGNFEKKLEKDIQV